VFAYFLFILTQQDFIGSLAPYCGNADLPIFVGRWERKAYGRHPPAKEQVIYLRELRHGGDTLINFVYYISC